MSLLSSKTGFVMKIWIDCTQRVKLQVPDCCSCSVLKLMGTPSRPAPGATCNKLTIWAVSPTFHNQIK